MNHVFKLGVLAAAALIACTVLLGPVGYLNLTAYELCTSVIIFCWIGLLVRFLDALGSTVTPPATAGSMQGVRPADPAAARPAAGADLTLTGRSGILRGGAGFSRTPRSGRR